MMNKETTTGGNPQKWPLTNGRSSPRGVANGLAITDPAKANGGREDTAATHGLINLNTANAKVIAQIPFTNTAATNQTIATAIVTHRETNGPFKNLFELHKVMVNGTRFQDVGSATTTPTLDPLFGDGDVTPIADNTPTTGGTGWNVDGVAGDFEARYMMINRISNMVTFRSDSFTAYVLVQGWRNAGTSTPELVVQRRAALVIDRSSVVPKFGTTTSGDQDMTSMTPTNVPNN
jgi:hypothetical protein